jgi:hypothetical protein
MFKSIAETGVGTTKTTIATVPSAKSFTILGLSCANVESNEVAATVYLFKDATSTEASLGNGLPVPPSSTLLVVSEGQKIIAEAGDEIRVESDTAASLDVVMSFLESDA